MNIDTRKDLKNIPFDQTTLRKKSILSKILLIFMVAFIIAMVFSLIFPLNYLLNSQYSAVYLLSIIFLFFILWTVLIIETLFLNPTSMELHIIKGTGDLLLILGILTAYFAVIIENKAFSLLIFINGILINNLGVTVNFAILESYFYAIIIPIIEELVKIFPVILLFGNYIRIILKSETFHTRLLPSQRIVVLYGGFFGAWFDLFEQIMIFSRYSSGSYSFLIFNRIIFPLHTTTSILAAFGLSIFYVNRPKEKNEESKATSDIARYVFLSIFLSIAIIYHSLWNVFAIIKFNQKFLLVLGYSTYFIFFILLVWAILKKPKYCIICHTEHAKEECPDVIRDFDLLRIKNRKRIVTHKGYLSSSNKYLCPSCSLQQFNGEYCEHCWSFPKLECNNCNQLVPIFSRLCWSCGAEQDTLYEKIPFSAPPYSVSFAVGFTRLLVSCFFISFLFTLPKLEISLTSLGYSLFYITINSALITVVVWYAFKNTKIKSMIASVVITSCVLIAFALLALYTAFYAVTLITSVFYASFGFISLASSVLIIIFCVFYLYKVVNNMHLIHISGEIYEKY